MSEDYGYSDIYTGADDNQWIQDYNTGEWIGYNPETGQDVSAYGNDGFDVSSTPGYDEFYSTHASTPLSDFWNINPSSPGNWPAFGTSRTFPNQQSGGRSSIGVGGGGGGGGGVSLQSPAQPQNKTPEQMAAEYAAIYRSTLLPLAQETAQQQEDWAWGLQTQRLPQFNEALARSAANANQWSQGRLTPADLLQSQYASAAQTMNAGVMPTSGRGIATSAKNLGLTELQLQQMAIPALTQTSALAYPRTRQVIPGGPLDIQGQESMYANAMNSWKNAVAQTANQQSMINAQTALANQRMGYQPLNPYTSAFNYNQGSLTGINNNDFYNPNVVTGMTPTSQNVAQASQNYYNPDAWGYNSSGEYWSQNPQGEWWGQTPSGSWESAGNDYWSSTQNEWLTMG